MYKPTRSRVDALRRAQNKLQRRAQKIEIELARLERRKRARTQPNLAPVTEQAASVSSPAGSCSTPTTQASSQPDPQPTATLCREGHLNCAQHPERRRNPMRTDRNNHTPHFDPALRRALLIEINGAFAAWKLGAKLPGQSDQET